MSDGFVVTVESGDVTWTGPRSWIWWPKEQPEPGDTMGEGWEVAGFLDDTP